MFTKQKLLEQLKEQLAIDFNCQPTDFSKQDNVITLPKANVGRREYISGTFFFRMTTLGGNAVISADERVCPWLQEYTKDKAGYWLFEHGHLREIDKQLERYGKQLWQTHHMFLPDMNIIPVSELAPVKWFEQEEMMQFYEGKPFPNALCECFNLVRPDVLAVAAYDENRIIGMAGCSADSPIMWQSGIDVADEYRGKGLGTYLVTLLKNEIIRREKLPFYGTSLSNLYSQNIARNSGFFPAWVEVETIELKK